MMGANSSSLCAFLYFRPPTLTSLCLTFSLYQAFIYFPHSRYCFHFSVCQGFPLHVFDFSIPSPQGIFLLQISASGETLQLLQMLKCWSHPLSAPRLPPLQVYGTSPLVLSAAGSCFCPLERPAADCTVAESVRSLQWTTNRCSKSTLMCKAN